MKSILITSYLLLATLYTSAQDFMVNVGGRKTTSLDGRWYALIDLYKRGEQMGVYKNKQPQGKTDFYEYLFSDNSRLNVPGDFNSQRPELLYYESSVWYKRDFQYDLRPGKRLFLYFGAANYRCTVYLNGEKLGSHEGGFTPFQFEITEKLRQGENFLIAEVNNARSAQAIPALIYDWWNYGGLTGNVMLVETPQVYIDDYFLRMEGGDTSAIKIDVSLSDPLAGGDIRVSIPEMNVDQLLRTDEGGKASGVVKVRGVSLWSPGNPKLYDVILSSAKDSVRERIGFRTVEVRGTQIVLNGEPVFLRGVNCHEEIPMRRGRAFSDIDAQIVINEVKALGCNFLRLTHYPASENMVRLAEQEGLLLFEEIPQWTDIDFKSESTNLLAREMMREMIRRDKNRCAVIAWSVANETKIYPERDRALISLVAMTREFDHSRLVTAVTNKIPYDAGKQTFIADDALLEHLDLVCVNRYMGWYTPWPAAPGQIRWDVCPDKPLVISEFGGEALYGNSGPADVASSWSEQYQEQLYRDNLTMFANIPNLRGTVPWVLFDFRSPYRMNLRYQEGWNRKGLISENGFRKKAWYVVRDYYRKMQENSSEK